MTNNTGLPYALEIYDTRVVSWGDAALLHREWAASLEDAESSRVVWLNTRAGRKGRYSIRIISRGQHWPSLGTASVAVSGIPNQHNTKETTP